MISFLVHVSQSRLPKKWWLLEEYLRIFTGFFCLKEENNFSKALPCVQGILDKASDECRILILSRISGATNTNIGFQLWQGWGTHMHLSNWLSNDLDDASSQRETESTLEWFSVSIAHSLSCRLRIESVASSICLLTGRLVTSPEVNSDSWWPLSNVSLMLKSVNSTELSCACKFISILLESN